MTIVFIERPPSRAKVNIVYLRRKEGFSTARLMIVYS